MGGVGTTECYMLNTENNEVQSIDHHPGEYTYFFSPSELKIGANLYALGVRNNKCSVFEFNTTTKKSV